MPKTAFFLFFLTLIFLPGLLLAQSDGGAVRVKDATREALLAQDTLWARALRLHYDSIVLDGHVDVPMRMLDEHYRIGQRHTAARSNVDLPRMAEGGLDGAFFSIYVPPGFGEKSTGTARARRMIDEVKRQVEASGGEAEMAYSAEEVRRITRSGRRAILLGLEGGHPLGGDVETLREFARLGVRYVGLTHINTHSWADASQSPPQHGGLTSEGRRMVREMNRLGLLVDLSHTSDSTFFDALETSLAPVILSHTSCRALVDNVRNASDGMLRALADNGGVVMINFFDGMVNRRLTPEVMAEVHRRTGGREGNLWLYWNVVYAVKRSRGIPGGTLEDVIAHIDHAVRVAGVDHVGLGSDFDGVFDLPVGLEDATRLPWITHALLARGYSEADVRKILGGNVLRVMEQAAAVAADLSGRPAPAR